jgi:hypothetical protein
VIIAAAWATEVVPALVLAAVALVIVGWLVVTRVFGRTHAGRHAAHWLDAGDDDMSPEDKVKQNTRHPGAGGYG